MNFKRSKEVNSFKRKRANKLQRKKLAKPRTSQQVIKSLFQDFEETSDILKIDEETYSIALEYTDISFSKAKYEEQINIFSKWVAFLHSFNENIHIEVVNMSQPIKTSEYSKDFLLTPHANHQRIVDEFNQLINNTIGDQDEILETKRIIVFSLKASGFDEAKDIFFDIQLKAEEKFKKLKSKIHRITTAERLELIHNFFNMDKVTNGMDYITNAKEKELTIFDVLATQNSNGCNFKYRDFFIIGKKYGRVLYVSEIPNSVTPRFYNKLTTNNKLNLITTLNISPTNTAKIMRFLENKLSDMKTERIEKVKKLSARGIDYGLVKDEKLESQIADAEQLKYDLQKNKQKLFNNNTLVCVLSDTYEQLVRDTNTVKDIAGEYLIVLKPLISQQLEGLQHCLPLGHNKIHLQRPLTSEATAANTPFNSKDLMQKGALFFGKNMVSNKGIFADRKKLLNGNGAILASSGAGKSYNVKMQIEQIRLKYPDDDIIIVEPNKEYGLVIDEFQGQTIEISTTANTYINPFDMDKNYDDREPVKEKIEYIIALVESIVGKLTGGHKTIIDRCAKRLFADYENSGFTDESKIPLLKDFYDELLSQPEKESKDMALVIERYVSGSVDIFARKTNVDINNHLVCFDISKLPKSLQTTGYLVVLDHVMNRLAKNRKIGRFTWLFIDEFHVLLENEFSSNYIAKIYKEGRKFFALPTIITQNIEEVLRSVDGVKILSNSEFAVILKQSMLDINSICDIFGISAEESEYITDSEAGQGLLYYAHDIYPFKNVVPEDFYIHALNNTSHTATV